MNKMLNVHKIILLCLLICLSLLLSMVFFGYGPSEKKVKALKREVADLEQSITGMRLPVERQALEMRLSQAKGSLAEAEERKGDAMKLYSSMYRHMIESHNWTMAGFFQQKPRPSRDLFMSEYERIVMASPFGNLEASQGRLGFTRDSDGEQRSLMLLQLWCAEKLMRTVKDCGLDLVFEAADARGTSGDSAAMRRGRRGKNAAAQDDSARKSVRQAALAILPVVELLGKGEERKPKMLRLEYRLGTTGTLENLMKFLDALAVPDTFFGIRSFELMLLPPGKRAAPKDEGTLRLNLALVTFVDLEALRENGGD